MAQTANQTAKQQPSPPAPAPANAPPAAAPPKERWTQWVALTTTILAVCAAISALKGGGYSTRVQLATTQEANRWAFFQAKSAKQHAVELHLAALEIAALDARSPEARALAQAGVAKAKEEVVRYDREKESIKKEAEAVQQEQSELKRHGAAFGLAVMLLQIAIMLSSVSALMKRPPMWGVGLAFGACGLVYMANGFLLLF